jgi:hypothetical protein
MLGWMWPTTVLNWMERQCLFASVNFSIGARHATAKHYRPEVAIALRMSDMQARKSPLFGGGDDNPKSNAVVNTAWRFTKTHSRL